MPEFYRDERPNKTRPIYAATAAGAVVPPFSRTIRSMIDRSGGISEQLGPIGQAKLGCHFRGNLVDLHSVAIDMAIFDKLVGDLDTEERPLRFGLELDRLAMGCVMQSNDLEQVVRQLPFGRQSAADDRVIRVEKPALAIEKALVGIGVGRPKLVQSIRILAVDRQLSDIVQKPGHQCQAWVGVTSAGPTLRTPSPRPSHAPKVSRYRIPFRAWSWAATHPC